MCGSDELIHDARQVDLEETIKMNETPMYLVPGRLTDEQARDFAYGHRANMGPQDALRAIAAIGTPIQPCADVETVGFVPDKSNLFVDKRLPMTNIYRSAGDPWPVSLVRRTDMDAQIARVVAEKDAEIARFRDALNDLVKSSRRVNAKGASTGPQWITFGASIIHAEYALKGPEA